MTPEAAFGIAFSSSDGQSPVFEIDGLAVFFERVSPSYFDRRFVLWTLNPYAHVVFSWSGDSAPPDGHIADAVRARLVADVLQS